MSQQMQFRLILIQIHLFIIIFNNYFLSTICTLLNLVIIEANSASE